MDDFHGYYEYLKNEIKSFKGDYDPYIDYMPDFFKLLTDLLSTELPDKEERKKISCALAYFIAPNDVIPEEIYGQEAVRVGVGLREGGEK